MFRFITALAALIFVAAPVQASPINFDISGVARNDSAWFGVSRGETLSGSLSIDDAVRKGKTGDVHRFELRIGNTVFDATAGNFRVNYTIRNNSLFKLNIRAKTQAFHRDYRMLSLDLSPKKTTLKIKDLGRSWIHIDNIEVERKTLATLFPSFGGAQLTSSVPEPANGIIFAIGLGAVTLLMLRRRT